MLGTLIKTQIMENLYGIKFVVTLIVCVLLVLGATVTGIGRYDNQRSEEQKVLAINRGNLEQVNDWHSVARTGIKIIKPATQLSIFASGLEESVGRTSTVRDGDFPHMEDSLYSTAPIFAVFGDLDLTFIIKIVISLFAILFTYDLISGEKERGTLKLCLSNSLPRNTFILGKSIGAFVSLLIALLVPLLVGLLTMFTFGNVAFSPDEWARFGIIVVGYALYMLAFFSVGVFVSAMTKRSAFSFLILLFVWVLFVLIVPKASMMIAHEIHPIPGINEVRAQQFQLQRDMWNQVWERTRQEFERLPDSVKSDDRSRRTQMRQLRTQVFAELEPEYLKRNERLVSGFKQQQANLTNLAMSLSRFSPASALTYIGMNLSGTGFEEQERFLAQLTNYRERFSEFIEMMEQKEEANRSRSFMHGPSAQGQLDLSEMPPFQYQRSDFASSFNLVLIDLMTMAILSIVFYLIGFVLFLRYDVR